MSLALPDGRALATGVTVPPCRKPAWGQGQLERGRAQRPSKDSPTAKKETMASPALPVSCKPRIPCILLCLSSLSSLARPCGYLFVLWCVAPGSLAPCCPGHPTGCPAVSPVQGAHPPPRPRRHPVPALQSRPGSGVRWGQCAQPPHGAALDVPRLPPWLSGVVPWGPACGVAPSGATGGGPRDGRWCQGEPHKGG